MADTKVSKRVVFNYVTTDGKSGTFSINTEPINDDFTDGDGNEIWKNSLPVIMQVWEADNGSGMISCGLSYVQTTTVEVVGRDWTPSET